MSYVPPPKSYTAMVSSCFLSSPYASEPLAGLGERDHRRRGPLSFLVDDDGGLATFHDRDDGVGGAQIDTDDFSGHGCSFCVPVSKTAPPESLQDWAGFAPETDGRFANAHQPAGFRCLNCALVPRDSRPTTTPPPA